MNINECVEKLLDAILAFDDIWEKEEDGCFLLFWLYIDGAVTPVKEAEKGKGCC